MDFIDFRLLAKTLTLVAIAQDADAIEIERLTPDSAAFEPGAALAGPHTLDVQVCVRVPQPLR